MGLAESVGHVLANYATFTGRASRSEYWWWWLTLLLAGSLIAIVAGLTGIDLLWWFSVLFWLAVIVPTFAVSIRRLHDTGRSGWWLLLGLVPILGFVLLVFYLLPSDPAANTYGAPPA